MAAVKTEEMTPNLGVPTNCVDPLDIEQYINPDNLTYSSPSMSPASSLFKSSNVTTPTPISQPLVHPQAEQLFSGPSHRYEQYRQQASLPVGAVANTFALNESYAFGQDDYGMIAPDNYFGTIGTDDYLDLNIGSEQPDLDMDFNTQSNLLPSMDDAPGSLYSAQSAYQSSSTGHVRAWPGMHQQAAMQAKAQAEIQAQRQQQVRQQSMSQSRESSSAHDDSHVEESISRLLTRMRHPSVSSSQADDRDTLGNHSSYLPNAQLKKDEEDMDEDERLLASEEGKKLSSKERRQLRNKVSARAFRSRRKEYIGQLEGELAAKAAEADRLCKRNDQLVAENTRLTDLTRMLLSSPHFSNFLDELSANKGSLPGLSQQNSQQRSTPAQQQQNQQAAVSKDVNCKSRQQNTHVGLAMIPEDPYEFSQPETTDTSWIQNNGSDQRVYAMTAIPDEPVIDTSTLSGKSVIEPLSSFGSMKYDVTEIETILESKPCTLTAASQRPAETHQPEEEVGFDESNPAYALFADEPANLWPSTTVESDTNSEEFIFGDIPLEKAFGRLEIVIRHHFPPVEGEASAAMIEKFERLRSHMDSISARIDAMTSDL